MGDLPELSLSDRIDLEIETRLQELWGPLMSDVDMDDDPPMVPLEQAMAAARYAYARGYYDGLPDGADGADQLGPATGAGPQWSRPENIDLS